MLRMPRDLVFEFIETLNAVGVRGSADPYRYLADDIEVDISGKTPISGVYQGQDQVRGILISTLKRRLSSFAIKIVDTIAEHELVAIKLVLSGVSSDGYRLNAKASICGAFVVVRQDKIAKIILIPDTDDIQSAIFGLTPVDSVNNAVGDRIT